MSLTQHWRGASLCSTGNPPSECSSRLARVRQRLTKHSQRIMSCYFGFVSNCLFARERVVLASVWPPLAQLHHAEVQFLRLPSASTVVPG